MKTEFKERRKYKRALFSIDQGLAGQFALSSEAVEASKPLVAPILDISEGGVGFLLDPSYGEKIRIDDKLVLTQLSICVGNHESFLDLKSDLPLTVRGKITADFLTHVGVGCDFAKITSDVWNEIKGFIEKTYPNCIV
jgi:c-di-GMP-binding flagellar brake protein YcgR